MWNKKSTGVNMGLCVIGLLVAFNLFALGIIGEVITIALAGLMTALLYVAFALDGETN